MSPKWHARPGSRDGSDDVYEDEPFIVGDMLIEMIAATQQESHIQIVYQTEQKYM
jgi:hypothetical protein